MKTVSIFVILGMLTACSCGGGHKGGSSGEPTQTSATRLIYQDPPSQGWRFQKNANSTNDVLILDFYGPGSPVVGLAFESTLPAGLGFNPGVVNAPTDTRIWQKGGSYGLYSNGFTGFATNIPLASFVFTLPQNQSPHTESLTVTKFRYVGLDGKIQAAEVAVGKIEVSR